MGPIIKVNGSNRIIPWTAAVLKSGLMVLDMKDFGKIISSMDMVDWCMPGETFILANGEKIRHLVLDHIRILVVLGMRGIGKMT